MHHIVELDGIGFCVVKLQNSWVCCTDFVDLIRVVSRRGPNSCAMLERMLRTRRVETVTLDDVVPRWKMWNLHQLTTVGNLFFLRRAILKMQPPSWFTRCHRPLNYHASAPSARADFSQYFWSRCYEISAGFGQERTNLSKLAAGLLRDSKTLLIHS